MRVVGQNYYNCLLNIWTPFSRMDSSYLILKGLGSVGKKLCQKENKISKKKNIYYMNRQ